MVSITKALIIICFGSTLPKMIRKVNDFTLYSINHANPKELCMLTANVSLFLDPHIG